MARTLEALFRYLDGLKGRAPLHDLVAELRDLLVSPNDLARYIHFTDGHYARNLVRSGKWYHLWVLCWKNGQRSPIHDHLGSSCAVKVLRGTATETLVEFAPNRHVKAVSSHDASAGSVLCSQDSDLHQISNLQADGDLITLHVYSPPLLRMGTYSLTDLSRGYETWLEERKFVTAFPENSETPVESIHGWVTANRLFFVRNHFDAPVLDRDAWRLRVEGLVERLLELTYEELSRFPEKSIFATVECAGNGRSFLQQRQPGVQWGAGAIGHAEWTGVPLHLVLEKAGIRAGALEVVFEGHDVGTEADHPEPMHFARSLPLPKALDPDTLLVYRMNGTILEPNHGFPVRLFVPGWYGVVSVKWLRRIEVINYPFKGYYQSVKYTVQRQTPHGTETVVVGPMAVKSEIIRPQEGASLGLGTNRIFGVAWAGEEAVGAVAVSTDGGQTWAPAHLIGLRAPYSWTQWEYLWEVAEPGEYSLLARAVTASGMVQPTEHDPLHGGYIIHHSRPTTVRLEATQRSTAQLGDAGAMLYDMHAFAEEMSRFRLDVDLEFAGGEGI